MEYTINRLAKLAGVSTRTLRYYDEANILKPARINSSGYRIYGAKEVDLLQQILFYKELDFSLEQIYKIINSPDYDRVGALKEHQKQLLERQQRLCALIANVEKTIAYNERRIEMSDSEKFEGFKQKLIDDNENIYGEEIRKKYGSKTVDKSNQKLMNMSPEQYESFEKIGEQVLNVLEQAFESGDPSGELAQKAAELHKQWLCFSWSEYSAQAHAGLAQMYVEDERFKAYYDKRKAGLAEFLRDAILIYTNYN